MSRLAIRSTDHKIKNRSQRLNRFNLLSQHRNQLLKLSQLRVKSNLLTSNSLQKSTPQSHSPNQSKSLPLNPHQLRLPSPSHLRPSNPWPLPRHLHRLPLQHLQRLHRPRDSSRLLLNRRHRVNLSSRRPRPLDPLPPVRRRPTQANQSAATSSPRN